MRTRLDIAAVRPARWRATITFMAGTGVWPGEAAGAMAATPRKCLDTGIGHGVQIRTNARKFAAEWKGATYEQSDAQTYMAEFLAIFGIERKRVVVFEQYAKRTSTSGDGRIDLFWPGALVWEHKSAGKSLNDAEAQALDYLDDLDQANSPEVVITSDFQSIGILDLTADAPKAHTIALTDLPYRCSSSSALGSVGGV